MAGLHGHENGTPQIQQVLLNLMRNALEAMADAERRHLVVSTAHPPALDESGSRALHFERRDEPVPKG